jgi:hypothetical protein
MVCLDENQTHKMGNSDLPLKWLRVVEATLSSPGPEVLLQTLLVEAYDRHATILCLIFKDREAAEAIVRKIEPVLFPPGHRANSSLDFRDEDATGELQRLSYYASSAGGTLSFDIEGIPAIVSEAVVRTLRDTGAIPLIFGYGSDPVVFIPPTDSSLFRSAIAVNGELYTGSRARAFNWMQVMRDLTETLNIK